MAGNFLGFQMPFGASNKPNPTATPPNNQQQQTQQQGNPNFPSNQQLQPQNNNNPANTANQNAGNNEPNMGANNNADPNKGQGSQLDQFKDLFKLPTDDKGNTTVWTDPLTQPLMPNVDPAKIREAAGKMNFVGGIDQELMQKAMSGQDPQAFLQVLQTVAANGFSQALQASTGVVETAFTRHNQRLTESLPQHIRQTQINQSQPKHAALSHPAAAPVLTALKNSLAMANPQLSPEQVAEKAEAFVIAMAGDVNAYNAQQQQATAPKKAGEVDWTATLGITGS